MGLPQVPTGNITEEVSASMGTMMQMQTRLAGTSSFDMGALHARRLSNRVYEDSPCTSAREDGHDSDLQNHGTANIHKLRIHSSEKSHFLYHQRSTNIQAPASRIVGFEPNALINNDKRSGNVPVSSEDAVASNGKGNSSYLVKKRLLSPHGMLSPDEFRGEHLDIGGLDSLGSFRLRGDITENKKAHTGSLDCSSPFIWSAHDFSRGGNSLEDEYYRTHFDFITDGPIPENYEHMSQNLFSSYQGNETSKTPFCKADGVMGMSREILASSPSSLSPLGTRFGRLRNSMAARNCTIEFNERYITLKDMEQSLEGTFSSILSAHKDGTEGKVLEDDETFPLNFEHLTPESLISMQAHNPISASHNARLGRTFGGLSVRRSLVGSFEESLLSGRLASGVVSQVCLFSLLFIESHVLLFFYMFPRC